jgi:hypothetical protein
VVVRGEGAFEDRGQERTNSASRQIDFVLMTPILASWPSLIKRLPKDCTMSMGKRSAVGAPVAHVVESLLIMCMESLLVNGAPTGSAELIAVPCSRTSGDTADMMFWTGP